MPTAGKWTTSMLRGISSAHSAIVGPNKSGKSKKFERCVIHIGTEKTGSTSIQKLLSMNRRVLSRRGFVYPTVTGRDGGSQWGFVAAVHDEPWAMEDIALAHGLSGPRDAMAFRERFVADLAKDLSRQRTARDLVISCEHFHSRLVNEEALARLKALLDPWVSRFVVLVYLRRQDRAAASLFSTALKSGRNQPTEFKHLTSPGARRNFEYDHLCERWSNVFGKQNLNVRLFAPSFWSQGDLLVDFAEAIGLSLNGLRLPLVENRSLNSQGFEFLRHLNEVWPRIPDEASPPARNDLVQTVARICASHEQYPFARKEAQGFYSSFADSNERVRKAFFGDRQPPLFDIDFTEYPETIENKQVNYSDAVNLTSRIWAARFDTDRQFGIRQQLLYRWQRIFGTGNE